MTVQHYRDCQNNPSHSRRRVPIARVRARRLYSGVHMTGISMVRENAVHSRASYQRVSRAVRRNSSRMGVQSSRSTPPARWNSGCHCSPITKLAR